MRRGCPNRNGGRHCCQPPLRRAKDLPVFMVLIPKDRFLEIQVHQLRRRFPSDNSLRRGDRPSDRLRYPKARLSPELSVPGRAKAIRCSAALLGSTTLASRFASSVRRLLKPRRARGRSTLPAPLPDWPRATPKSLSLPVGGDRSFRHPPLPSCRCRPSGGGGDFRPDHP